MHSLTPKKSHVLEFSYTAAIENKTVNKSNDLKQGSSNVQIGYN